ncbi:MAG: SpoIID/LytB domain-containing protein [Candidatus Omnitrophota bacterium]
MKRTFRLIILFLFCLAGSAFCQLPEHIRVAVKQDASALRLKVQGDYEVWDTAANKVIYRGSGLNTTVTAYSGGILLGELKSYLNKLIIKSHDPDAIIIDGRMFRGDIQLTKKADNNILVINNIEFEDYVKGVLYHEASHYWPNEALKAQAIVCRSYAVSRVKENSSRDFDATADTYSQVYGGKTSERFRTSKAVEDTKGEVLTYQGQVLPAYFHATCAGHTEDASNLWNINLPPLKGVACGFCKDSPHFSWHYVFSKKEIIEKLSSAGYKIKQIKDIKIASRNNSSRVTSLVISSNGDEVKVLAKDFRNISGPNIIRSTNFQVRVVKDDVVFEGIGWGHGVGLCQWGAYFMSKQDWDYKKILKYYYPGASISSLK